MKELLLALGAFQKDCPQIKRSSIAKGQKFSYNYASFEEIDAITKPLLVKHGLLVNHFVNGINQDSEKLILTTTLFHVETGQKMKMETPIPDVNFQNMNKFQSTGAGITYIRRYCYSLILGIVTEEDGEIPETQTTKTQDFENKQLGKDWLNPNTEKWAKAVEYLTEGGSINEITDKYRLSTKNREKILSESLG